jgi:O-antigen/teichoic acid export membrane protein
VGTDKSARVQVVVPRSESLLSKTGFSAVAGLIAVLGRMVAGIAAMRMLGRDVAGQLAYLLWVGETLAIINGLGLPAAATRFIADLKGQGMSAETAIVRWTYPRFVVLAIVGTVIAIFVGRSTTLTSQSPMLGWSFGVYFLAVAMGTFHMACLAGHQNFQKIARLNTYSSILLVSAVLVLTPIWGLQGALLAYLAGALPLAFARIRVGGKLMQSPEMFPQLRSRVLWYALYTWYGAVMAALTWSRAEIFFLKTYWGDAEVSMFTVGVSLSLLATQGPTLLAGALLAHFAQLRGAGETEQIKALFISGTRLMALLLFPLCFGLASITSVLLPLVYGDEFVAAVPNAVVLIASSIVVISTVSTSLLYAMEKAKVIAIMSTVGAIATIAGGTIIVAKYGAWGAAWSRLTVQIGMVLLTMVYLTRVLQVCVPYADLIKTLLAAALAAGSCAVAVWRFGPIVGVVCGIPLAVCVYFVLVRYAHLLHSDDLDPVRRLVARLPASAHAYTHSVLAWLSRPEA